LAIAPGRKKQRKKFKRKKPIPWKKEKIVGGKMGINEQRKKKENLTKKDAVWRWGREVSNQIRSSWGRGENVGYGGRLFPRGRTRTQNFGRKGEKVFRKKTPLREPGDGGGVITS